MTDHPTSDEQLSALFHRVGGAVHPDVASLVAAGVERGARRRRHRRAGVALAAAAAVVVAVLVPASLLAERDDPAPSEDRTTDQVPRVPVPADEMTATLQRLLPTSTPADDEEPYELGIQRGVVQWRGVQVSVSVDDRFVDSSTSPQERCETFAARPCTRAGDAGWLTAFGTMNGSTDGGLEPYRDVVRLYGATGYVVEATGERNDAQAVDEGRGSDADPSVLRRLVLDDAWFR